MLMHNKTNLFFRLILIFLAIIPLFYLNDFYLHFKSHFTGTIIGNMVEGQWIIVLLNILVFISFLIPLSFRRKINWREYGLVTAFFVSLFIEMYGIPLSVFFASKTIASSGGMDVPIFYAFDFFGVNIAMTLAMTYSLILMTLGMILIIIAWVVLYRNIQNNELVTTGIYSVSRHPQYLGFLLIIIGWFVGWPTPLTVVFTAILVYKYLRVCKIEERELVHISKYEEYKKNVPFMI